MAAHAFNLHLHPGERILQLKLLSEQTTTNLYQIKTMLTENSRKFKILKVTSDKILCMISQTGAKFIYWQLEAPLSSALEKRLNKLMLLSHANIIKLYRLDLENTDCQNYRQNNDRFLNCQPSQGFKAGLYIENYAGSLSQYIRCGDKKSNLQTIATYDQEDILNTFLPLIDVIQVLSLNNIVPQTFSIQNIVFTEDGSIKYLDNCLITNNYCSANQLQIERNDEMRVYEEISDIIYKLLMPNCSSKSWKVRIKNLKAKLNSENYGLFMKFYQKSLHGSCDEFKTKKISKQSKERKLHRKCCKKGKQIDKQNKILQ